MLFELNVNDVFVSLSSAMSQNTGFPIGGSTAAQAASLVLIYKELRGDLLEELKNLMWLRYRDNFLILHQPDTVNFSMDQWTTRVRQGFAKMTHMEITTEQQGLQLTSLECELCSPCGPHPVLAQVCGTTNAGVVATTMEKDAGCDRTECPMHAAVVDSICVKKMLTLLDHTRNKTNERAKGAGSLGETRYAAGMVDGEPPQEPKPMG